MPQQVAELSEIFDGQTVVIRGAASGIGLAAAHMVVDRGGRFILMGRCLERLKAAQEQLGPTASIIPLGVIDQHAVKTAFADIERIDHLVTAAARTLRGRLVDLDTHRARQLFEVKFGEQHH